MREAAPNIHVDTDERPLAGLSEVQKVIGLVRFWHRWLPAVRAAIVEEIEAGPDYVRDAYGGIKVAVLRGLEQVDPEALAAELRRLHDADGNLRAPEVGRAAAHSTGEGGQE